MPVRRVGRHRINPAHGLGQAPAAHRRRHLRRRALLKNQPGGRLVGAPGLRLGRLARQRAASIRARADGSAVSADRMKSSSRTRSSQASSSGPASARTVDGVRPLRSDPARSRPSSALCPVHRLDRVRACASRPADPAPVVAPAQCAPHCRVKPRSGRVSLRRRARSRHSSPASVSVRSFCPAYQVATHGDRRPAGPSPSVRPTSEVTRSAAGDLLGDGQRPLLDAQRACARHQGAEQGLPDQRVDESEDHRVPGDRAEQQEQRGVGDGGDQRGDRVGDGDLLAVAVEDEARDAASAPPRTTMVTAIATISLVKMIVGRFTGLASR